MKTLAALVLACVFFMPHSAAAQTQAAMTEGARADYTAARQELTRVYDQILKAHQRDSAFVLHFKAAQQAWALFRDAHVAAIYPAADKARAYGSTYQLCRLQVLTALTKERTKQLQQWIDPPEEGDVCVGSRAPASK
ncbi:MAG TPA: lysozyme inhibitor LprI family protein [Vicinamibacterales bacterium]|jgi:uncharacterized protein YecT (DUF1311 family)